MLLALALASMGDWVPARWNSSDPQTLDLAAKSAINCLLVEKANWSAAFNEQAARRGIAVLGVVRPGDELKELPQRLAGAKFSGAVIEGASGETAVLRAAMQDSRLALIEMEPRTRMRFDSGASVLATNQGVWPGINAMDDGKAKAAPSGAPWIDTNTGFLRFVRSITRSGIWIGNQPPMGKVYPIARYLQVQGEAAMVGARWVIALDADFEKRLLAREDAALAAWSLLGEQIAFTESRPEWRKLDPYGNFALVQDVDSGGLISGGILDMITVKHTPVRPIPARKLEPKAMEGAQLAVNVDPSALNDRQKETLRGFTRGGGTLLTAPPGWRFPPQREDQITLDESEIEKLDAIWKEVNSLTGRRNLGVRLFNVSSMLSNVVAPESGKPVVLHLVNYSDYPVENVTAHVLGKFSKATLYEPGAAQGKKLNLYESEDGTGIDLDKVTAIATLVLE